jgi:2-polyprenyl-3-methyl-5-hydroxy-6-metoxy-1,4-benzoquinol methylase
MDSYEKFFLQNHSYFSYVYVISKLEKYNTNIIEKYSSVSQLYNGKPNFNTKIFDDILNSDYLDNNKLECITYFLEYLLYWTSTHISIKEKDKRFDFLSFFTHNIQQIMDNFQYKETDSVEGYLVFSDFLKLKSKLAIKTPKSSGDVDSRNLLYEYYIGSNFLNKLRSKTPNFMYTYGIFMCNSLLRPKSMLNSSLVINSDFCKDSNKKNLYVVFEKIEGKQLLEKCYSISTEKDLDDILNYLIQVLFSLAIAQEEGQYVHNDLHTKNVMIRDIGSPYVHEYNVNNTSYKMNLNSIATIIDFGMNRFVENGIPIGSTTFYDMNMIPYLNTTSYDVYKVIMSTIAGIEALFLNNKFSTNLIKKKDEIVDVFMSFFQNKRDYYDLVKNWVEIRQKPNNKQIMKKYIDNLITALNEYFALKQIDNAFYSQVTPINVIEHIRTQFPNEWNKHIVSTLNIEEDKLLKIHINIYDPLFTEEEYNDYLFSKIYNNDIYLLKYMKQKDTFFNMFNKKLSPPLNINNCLINQESLILNTNSLIDLENTLDELKKDTKDTKVISVYKSTITKNLDEYYENDIELLNYYITEMNTCINNLDKQIMDRFNEPKLFFLDINLYSDNMKKQLRNAHEFIKFYQKYLFFINCSIDVKEKYNSLDFKKFTFDKKYNNYYTYFRKCINIHSIYSNQFYFSNLIDSQYNNKNNYMFFNILTCLENIFPLNRQIFVNYGESLIEYKKKKALLGNEHYIPVNSRKQFKKYLSIGELNIQKKALFSLISRKVELDENTFDSILNLKNDVKSKDLYGVASQQRSDVDIYKELRKYKKPDINKEKRNKKRGSEIVYYINKNIPRNYDMKQFYHLDFGGNDGSVASEISSLMNLSKEHVYSADIETWLGNSKPNTYQNITYNVLSENQDLPFNPNSFNSISCLQVFHHVQFLSFYLQKLYNVLKPGGVLILREHDCSNTSTQLLIDIEHVLYEYVLSDTPNENIFDTYYAFYKSYKELRDMIESVGFKYITSNYNYEISINPTRYYYSVYKKI